MRPSPTRHRSTVEGATDVPTRPGAAARAATVAGGVALLVLLTAWPWVVVFGWTYRGDARFWASAVGWLAVVAYTWLVLLDERAVRAVRDLRVPSPTHDARLRSVLDANGLAAVVPWLGDVPVDAPVLVAHAGRRHAVLAPACARDEVAAAAAAERLVAGFASLRPWWTPYGLLARLVWRGPFEVVVAALRTRTEAARGPDVAHLRVSPSRSTHPVAAAAAWLAAGGAGYVCAGLWALASGDPGSAGLDRQAPWRTVVAYAVLTGLLWVALAASATRWSPVPADDRDGIRDAPRVLEDREEREDPEDSGDTDDTDDADDAGLDERLRGAALDEARSSGVVRPFLAWVAASAWVLVVPLGLADRFGWVSSGTGTYQLLYLLLAAPGTACLLVRPAPGGSGQRDRRAWGAGYVAATGLTPLLLGLLERVGAVPAGWGGWLPVVAAVTAGLALAATVPLVRHLDTRRAQQPTGGS